METNACMLRDWVYHYNELSLGLGVTANEPGLLEKLIS
jgi:hypothetical protein